jgi:uncharacterized protein (DUF433 family)
MSVVIPDKVDLSKYIEMRDGRANIRGRRLPVAFIAIGREQNKVSVEELAYEYTLTEEQVLAALLYYREHQAEIDSEYAADYAASEETNRKNQNWPPKV